VSIDGKPLGTTPFTNRQVLAGTHAVKFERNGLAQPLNDQDGPAEYRSNAMAASKANPISKTFCFMPSPSSGPPWPDASIRLRARRFHGTA
jgi:hypothetical protein